MPESAEHSSSGKLSAKSIGTRCPCSRHKTFSATVSGHSIWRQAISTQRGDHFIRFLRSHTKPRRAHQSETLVVELRSHWSKRERCPWATGENHRPRINLCCDMNVTMHLRNPCVKWVPRHPEARTPGFALWVSHCNSAMMFSLQQSRMLWDKCCFSVSRSTPVKDNSAATGMNDCSTVKRV